MTYTSPALATVGCVQALVLGFVMDGEDNLCSNPDYHTHPGVALLGLDD
jgi:hypothetical protein